MKGKEENLPKVQETGGLPAIYDFGDDSGAGLENIDKDEIRIPILTVLQAQSPQVMKPVGQGGIEGAKAGSVFNTSTNEIYAGPTGFEFVPIMRDHNYVEYTPRDDGGGFVGIRPVDDDEVIMLRADQGRFGKLMTSNGTELSETRYLYGLMMIGDQVRRGVLTFTSAKIKQYQAFVDRVTGITYRLNEGTEADPVWKTIVPPIWAHRWKVTTFYDTRSKKGDFWNWSVVPAEEPPIKALLRRNDPLYVQAKETFEMIRGGSAKADYEKATSASVSAEEEIIPL